MKIKYIGERDVDIIPDKVYEVMSVERDWYRIVDESDEDYLYPPELFEIVDAEPDVKHN